MKDLFLKVRKNLREINFGDSRSTKTAFYAISGGVNLVTLVNYSLQKVQKIHEIQSSEPLNVSKGLILHFKNP